MNYAIAKGDGMYVEVAITQVVSAVNKLIEGGYKPFGNMVIQSYEGHSSQSVSDKITKYMAFQPMIKEN